MNTSSTIAKPFHNVDTPALTLDSMVPYLVQRPTLRDKHNDDCSIYRSQSNNQNVQETNERFLVHDPNEEEADRDFGERSAYV